MVKKRKRPKKQLIDDDVRGESGKEYEARDNYIEIVEQDDRECFLHHTHSAHLTYHKANGSVDKKEGYEPIPLIDTSRTPRLGIRYRRRIVNPPNRNTPMMNDCVMLAFYPTKPGTNRWGGRLQVICRKVYEAPTSVWLYYNGLGNQAWRQLENRPDRQDTMIFTSQKDMFQRVHPNWRRYRERIYMSVGGCKVRIIGEASLRQADGTLVRTTKIHRIDCCKEEDDAI
jgi:hypothetical protein